MSSLSSSYLCEDKRSFIYLHVFKIFLQNRDEKMVRKNWEEKIVYIKTVKEEKGRMI